MSSMSRTSSPVKPPNSGLMLSTLFLFCLFCASGSRISLGNTSGYVLRSCGEPAAKTAATTIFTPLDRPFVSARYFTSSDSCSMDRLISEPCVDSRDPIPASVSSASLSSQSASSTSNMYPNHAFQYFHLFGYATLQLNAHPTICQKSFALRRMRPWFATTPPIASSSPPDSLLPSSAMRPRRAPRVLNGDRENASPRLPFRGPSVARRLRRNVRARHATSTRSPLRVWVVCRG